MTRSQGLNSNFSTVVRHGGNLGHRSRRFWPSGFYFIFTGDVSLRTGSPPHLECLQFVTLVAAVFIKPKGAESPGSGRIGMIGALVFFSI